jgi:hypothetical protein
MKTVKTLILTLAVVTMFVDGLYAQTKLVLSPEIGMQFSRMKATGDLDESSTWPNQEVDYGSIFSYNGGVTVGIQFAEHWSITTGLKFNRKGGDVTVAARDPQFPFPLTGGGGDLGEFKTTITSNWLSIPILAGAEFGNKIKVGLGIGPQINIGVGEYKVVTEYNLDNTNIPTAEESEEYGDGANNLLKGTHTSLLLVPYVSYELSKQSSIRFTVMIESGSDMVNENLVVSDGLGGARKVNGTLKNNQFGFSISYVHTFDMSMGTKF